MKNNTFFLLFLSLSLLFINLTARADEERMPAKPTDYRVDSGQNIFDPKSFQLGAVVALQDGGSSFSVLGRYKPEFKFEKASTEHYFGVGFDLALSSFNMRGESAFLVVEYGAFGAYHFSPRVDFTLYVAAQTWTSGNGTAFSLTPQFNYHFENRSSLVDGVYLSYNTVFKSSFVSIFGVGVNFNFN
jgi:hypothetical protein